MFATLVIVLRETLEAMLVVGIATAAARQSGIQIRWVYMGLVAGLSMAMLVALCTERIASSLSGMGQEVLNASILLSASCLMVWTALWMAKHGRETSMRIKEVCKRNRAGSACWVLATVIALAIAREGAEVVLFLYGVQASLSDGMMAMWMGGLIGLMLGIVLALVLYRGLVRLPMRYVFSTMTWLIIFLAAGMASQGVSYLVMVDALPALAEPIWNTSSFVSERSIGGQVLQAFMGYDDRPSGMQVLAFIGVIGLTCVGFYAQRVSQVSMKRVATASVFLLTVFTMLPSDAQAKKVYSPIVEQGEIEVEYTLDYTFDGDPAKHGSIRHQFEFEAAVTDRWLTALYLDFRRRPLQDLAYQGLKWENIYQLFEQGQYVFDAAIYLEYIQPKRGLHKPDALEVKLLLEKERGRYIHTLNAVFKRELTAQAVIKLGYTWRSKWRWQKSLEFAVESYGWFGDVDKIKPISAQAHQIGPVLMGKTASGLNYEVGYLFALTNATAQGALKVGLGYEF